MSLKTSIGWTDMTLNPIKGLCQGGCWYCYYSGQRGIAHRFKQDPKLHLDLSVFDRLPKAPKRIFLCSTNDYWGDWITDEWRDAIRSKTQEYPQHIFQVLTKQYQNLGGYSPYPDNWWVGGTSVNNHTYLGDMVKVEAKVKFISFEPLMEWLNFPAQKEQLWDILGNKLGINWVIIGRLTGYGHKHDPKIEWVEEIVRACDKAGAKVFLKNNLIPLMGGYPIPKQNMWAYKFEQGEFKLRQEMPT